MLETPLRNGALIVTAEADDTDSITVTPVVTAFNSIKGRAYCACGAPLEPWSVHETAKSTELICHQCHRTLGILELGVRTFYR